MDFIQTWYDNRYCCTLWSTIETCWRDEPHTHFIIPFYIQGREPYLYDFVKKTLMVACIQTFTTNFFLTWYDDKDHEALHFDMDDLDIPSRSQLCKK